MKLWNRFSTLFARRRLEREMSEEIRAHIDGLTERNIAAGLSPEEARYAALRTFGGVEQIKEQARDVRGWRWFDETLQDLRFALRMMRKSPGVTFTAVLTLTLGMGVNAALFSFYDFVILQPLPSRQPNELVDIQARNEQVPGRIDPRFSYPDYLDYCAGTQTFSDIVAVAPLRAYLPEETPAVIGSPQESTTRGISLQAVSGNYFPGLGGEIALGRGFLPGEAGLHSGRPVMVLSHLFWETHLHKDAKVLGTTLAIRDLDGKKRETAYTIIGVAAPSFLGQSADTPAAWIPLTANPAELGDRLRPLVSLTGRMKAGVSPPQAKADLDAIARRLEQQYPAERRPTSVHLAPGMMLVDSEYLTKVLMPMSPILLGFALTLVIACLNVANLFLARGITRQHEIGVRLALGAGRGRIVRQLFAENFLLCGLGAVAAMLLAIWTLQGLRPIAMSAFADLPEVRNYLGTIQIGLDWRIIGFGALLAAVAGLTAGLVPALHSVRRDGVFALKREGSALGRKMTPPRLRALLLVSQVAVCLTLLSVSGLMTGKLMKMDRSDSGLSMERVYQMKASDTAGAGTLLAQDPLGAIETLRTLPGVASACLVSEIPMRKPGDNFSGINVKIADGKPQGFAYSRVSAGFFETCGVPVLRGRAFTPREVVNGADVVIVSETAAERLWPGEDAVGKFLSVDVATLDRESGQPAPETNQNFRPYAVIGVAGGIRNNWSQNDRKQLLWFPPSAKRVSGSILVRLQTDSRAVLPGVERMAAAAGVPLEFKEKLATIVDRSLWPFRAFARFSSVLSGLALIMATIGLYGMMAFGVNQRVHEIGVRMALGATAERVTALFVRQGMRLVAWGTAVGLGAGTAFAVLLGKALPGAGFAGDMMFRGVVFAVVTAFLFTVALLACWLPARRAAKVDPMEALRCE
ncbi:ABC transporter permease [Horticoccus luteus]|uniref:ABC transporter permease n=1 Tax=Horticoccus luteus TaxID=2862869 RepID=A0A8F9TY20_9BACT|nr:ABC transporter permease [Horticoccus luteus]QYM80323.1 ABC transporter permease [Horticoccus luteus]